MSSSTSQPRPGGLWEFILRQRAQAGVPVPSPLAQGPDGSTPPTQAPRCGREAPVQHTEPAVHDADAREALDRSHEASRTALETSQVANQRLQAALEASQAALGKSQIEVQLLKRALEASETARETSQAANQGLQRALEASQTAFEASDASRRQLRRSLEGSVRLVNEALAEGISLLLGAVDGQRLVTRMTNHCRENDCGFVMLIMPDGTSSRRFIARKDLHLFESLFSTKAVDEDSGTQECTVCMCKGANLGCGNSHNGTECAGRLCWDCWHIWYAANNKCPNCRGDCIPLTLRTR